MVGSVQQGRIAPVSMSALAGIAPLRRLQTASRAVSAARDSGCGVRPGNAPQRCEVSVEPGHLEHPYALLQPIADGRLEDEDTDTFAEMRLPAPGPT